jgi:hypothetical protein
MSIGRRNYIRFGAVALTSVATLTGTAAAAGAATSGSTTTTTLPTTLSGIQSQASTKITTRVNALNAAIAKVKSAKGLGAGQSTLESYLGTEIAPLQQLNTKIQGDPSVQAATADYETIFSNYRIYYLVLPAARAAANSYRIVNTQIPHLQKAATSAQQKETPTNQPMDAPLISNLNSDITTASNATNGLAATVLAYTPAQWNANNALLDGAQASIKQAHSAVAQGHADVRQIRGKSPKGANKKSGALGHVSVKHHNKSTTTTS